MKSMTSSITRRSTRRNKDPVRNGVSNEMEVETGEEKKMKLVKLEPDPAPANELAEEQGKINIKLSWL